MTKRVFWCWLAALALLAAFASGGTYIPANPNAATLPINLAGGSGVVTGVLPTGNQASQAMGGDISGTTAAATVQAISGTSPIVVTPNALQWVKGATPLLTQAAQTTDTPTLPFGITTQAPWASATTNKSTAPFVVSFPAPVSGDGTGNSGYLDLKDGTLDVMQFGYGLNGDSFQSAIVAPGTQGLTLQSNGSSFHAISGGGSEFLDADTHTFRSANGGTTFITLTTGGFAVYGNNFIISNAASQVQVGIPVGGNSAATTAALQWVSTTVGLGGSNVTLSAGQQACPLIKFTGTLTANVAVTFPAVNTWWVLDFGAIVFGGFNVSLKTGTGARQASVTSQTRALMYADGVGSTWYAPINN